jgi:hypothetical protein
MDVNGDGSCTRQFRKNERKNDGLSLPSCFFDGGEVTREMSPTKNLQRERVKRQMPTRLTRGVLESQVHKVARDTYIVSGEKSRTSKTSFALKKILLKFRQKL